MIAEMKMAKGKLAFAALILWESYWTYVYLTASVPDTEMAMPAAILFGGVIPIILLTLGAAAIWLGRTVFKRRW
ncbi:hypothetical protein FSZ31_11540 [Sphingorhabdus soli]|uniref:Uncharacterized protein n=1 Tax=Flavisphingopyxis soli TaxID=2601267 RepID=A0A5C6U624_9SPHN|nr:hypothetical protein [Sphingorhabdus soli]TXC68304.1 hypothetical protein FSZ31_11540 [Sphingorhabdus soli]